jgi:hypothetical protein
MYRIRAKHRSLTEEVAELVSLDLCIEAGEQRIARLALLVNRPDSADGHARTRILIETIAESVQRLRAYRAIVVRVILASEKNRNRSVRSDDAAEGSVFQDRGTTGELARAIDAEMCALVMEHGAQKRSEGAAGRLNRYQEIEFLQGALERLGVGRHVILPYIERFVHSR